MKYRMLLWPHANARYQNEALKLARGELRLMLDVLAPAAAISGAEEMSMPALEIEAPEPLSTETVEALRAHSLMYGLFEVREDRALIPLAGRADARVGADLPGILKYKGKTNELFLQLLINAALYSGDFARRAGEALELLDPMCGRGTALFVGANRGWNATGVDVDKNDLSEAEKYLKRYFEYHRMKHSFSRESRTAPDGKGVGVARFRFAATPERFRAGDCRALQLARLDAARVRQVFGGERFHLIACDLPYGVQHAPVGGGLEDLLARALPEWRGALKKGGSVALAFNAQTLRRERVIERMEAAGLEPCRGGAYEEMSHWVEQAVTRDIAVGRRKK